MNKIFIALFISLIPLVSAHAGLVQVENRVSCYLALKGNETLMESSGRDIAFTKSWLHNELARHGVDQNPLMKTSLRWKMNCPGHTSRQLSRINASLITATPPTAKVMNSTPVLALSLTEFRPVHSSQVKLMKNIILTTCILAASASASAAQISLETAGRCYEATRQSTQMAMLLDPDARNTKILATTTRSCLARFPAAWAKRTRRKYAMRGKPFWIMQAWKEKWRNQTGIVQ